MTSHKLQFERRGHTLAVLGPEPGADQHLITQARTTLDMLDEIRTQ